MDNKSWEEEAEEWERQEEERERETKERLTRKAPERIWLQVADDLGDEAYEFSWCEDKQFKFDVEYIRLDLHEKEINELKKQL